MQDIGPVFAMPLEVGVTAAEGDTVLGLWFDELHGEFTLEVADEPRALSLDPDRWVLCQSTEVPYAGVSVDGATGGGLELEVAPNPSRGGAGIRYTLPAGGPARVLIYDAAGRVVDEVLDGALPAGTGELRWDGRRASGEAAAPGTYFCRVYAAGAARSARIVLLG